MTTLVFINRLHTKSAQQYHTGINRVMLRRCARAVHRLLALKYGHRFVSYEVRIILHHAAAAP